MPGPQPHPPAALHLVRLAKVTPDERVMVPGGPMEALHLTRAQAGSPGGAAVCLEGELLVDFADGSFLHLRPGEACALPLAHRLVPARGRCTALLVGAAGA